MILVKYESQGELSIITHVALGVSRMKMEQYDIREGKCPFKKSAGRASEGCLAEAFRLNHPIYAVGLGGVPAGSVQGIPGGQTAGKMLYLEQNNLILN